MRILKARTVCGLSWLYTIRPWALQSGNCAQNNVSRSSRYHPPPAESIEGSDTIPPTHGRTTVSNLLSLTCARGACQGIIVVLPKPALLLPTPHAARAPGTPAQAYYFCHFARGPHRGIILLIYSTARTMRLLSFFIPRPAQSTPQSPR